MFKNASKPKDYVDSVRPIKDPILSQRKGKLSEEAMRRIKVIQENAFQASMRSASFAVR